MLRQKFYNPTLYKAPPKTEMTMEEKIIDAGTFVQIKAHDEEDSDVTPPDTAFSSLYQKSEKSAGVIGLMDMMVKDLEISESAALTTITCEDQLSGETFLINESS